MRLPLQIEYLELASVPGRFLAEDMRNQQRQAYKSNPHTDKVFNFRYAAHSARNKSGRKIPTLPPSSYSHQTWISPTIFCLLFAWNRSARSSLETYCDCASGPPAEASKPGTSRWDRQARSSGSVLFGSASATPSGDFSLNMGCRLPRRFERAEEKRTRRNQKNDKKY